MSGEEFIKVAERLVGPLDDVQRDRFLMLEGLYKEWNEKINVISRKDIDEIYLHHVLHSLAIAGYMKAALPEDFSRAAGSSADRLTFLDVGTGGGFPGIPLAILFSGADFTLCDSVGKKIRVADDIASRLGLQNVRTVNARAESLPDTYDYIVTRAVTGLENFLPWVKGKYGKGILFLKGGDIAEEIAVAMGRFRMRKGSVHTWRIDSWAGDPYFGEKFVIFIENFCK